MGSNSALFPGFYQSCTFRCGNDGGRRFGGLYGSCREFWSWRRRGCRWARGHLCAGWLGTGSRGGLFSGNWSMDRRGVLARLRRRWARGHLCAGWLGTGSRGGLFSGNWSMDRRGVLARLRRRWARGHSCADWLGTGSRGGSFSGARRQGCASSLSYRLRSCSSGRKRGTGCRWHRCRRGCWTLGSATK